MKATSVALATTLMLAAGAAAAGNFSAPPPEPVVPAPMPHVPFNWTGGYAGIGLGYVRASYTNEATLIGTMPDSRGAQISALLGYNWQGAGSGVFGGELLIAGGSADGSEPCNNLAWTCESELGTTAALRLRAGVAMDRTLLFATLGYAVADVSLTTISPGGTAYPASHRVSGPTFGIGAEHALANDWNVRGDIEAYRFGRETFVTDDDYPMETNTTAVRISLVRRF